MQYVMSQTAALVKHRFGILTDIIMDYFLPRRMNDRHIAMAGYYEACNRIHNINVGLANASRGGHLKIVQLMVYYGATNFSLGLRYAWEYGHDDVAAYLISRGIDSWNHPLRGACRIGDQAKIELCISHGITDWHPAACGACRGGNLEIYLKVHRNKDSGMRKSELIKNAVKGGNIDLLGILINYEDAIRVHWAIRAALGYGNQNAIEFIRRIHYNHWLSVDWNTGMFEACHRGNINGMRLAIHYGAKDYSYGFTGAVQGNQTEVAEMLIAEYGVKLDENLSEYDTIDDLKFASAMIPRSSIKLGRFLRIAFEHDRYEIAHMIINMGASQDRKLPNYKTVECETGLPMKREAELPGKREARQ